ncbi:MAG: hypothetical protein CM1200mP4_4710 [Rhodospirillaceae bacterium]|nr:MAG: hypothetical protein CM1200mP4_4710 [Rhodospirillaceae bacterium]
MLAYRAQKWNEAEELSKICNKLAIPWKAAGYMIACGRGSWSLEPISPGNNGEWDGVYVAATK